MIDYLIWVLAPIVVVVLGVMAVLEAVDNANERARRGRVPPRPPRRTPEELDQEAYYARAERRLHEERAARDKALSEAEMAKRHLEDTREFIKTLPTLPR
jgi:hypothetical protein